MNRRACRRQQEPFVPLLRLFRSLNPIAKDINSTPTPSPPFHLFFSTDNVRGASIRKRAEKIGLVAVARVEKVYLDVLRIPVGSDRPNRLPTATPSDPKPEPAEPAESQKRESGPGRSMFFFLIYIFPRALCRSLRAGFSLSAADLTRCGGRRRAEPESPTPTRLGPSIFFLALALHLFLSLLSLSLSLWLSTGFAISRPLLVEPPSRRPASFRPYRPR